MSTLNKISYKNQPKDPIEVLIFEKGLRIKALFIEKDLDLLLIILNNGNLIKYSISNFNKLKDASQEELSNYELRNDGTGIHWPDLDEDLSLYGFIKDAGINLRLNRLLKRDSKARVV